MGNVSSADHDKVNELLTRRAKKKIGDRNKKLQQQQLKQQLQQQQQQQQQQQPSPPQQPQQQPQHQHQQQQQSRIVTSNVNGSQVSGNSNGYSGASLPTTPNTQQPPHPLDQADFYTAATWKANGITPHSPSSPSFSIPSSATTPTSSTYQNDSLYSPRFDDRMGDGLSTSASPTSPQRPPQSNLPFSQYHSSPIVVPQHRPSHTSTGSVDETHFAKGHASSGYMPPRRGSEHHLHHLHQTPDPHLLGTSPEAKDWLKQKPTRSSTHMIHQYNFHTHQYYQQPGSMSVKVVNNTCRNMGDYPNVPTVSGSSPRSLGANTNQGPMSATLSNGRTSTSKSTTSLTSLNSNSTVTAAAQSGNVAAPGGSRTYSSAPIPNSRARGLSQPEANAAQSQNGRAANYPVTPLHTIHSQGVNLSAPPQKLVMSRSKLASPLAASVLSSPSNGTHSPPLGSPLERSTTSEHSVSSDIDGDEQSATQGSRPYRPSSTLSSLRSLLGNHPQGLSLIESLEEEDDDGMESLSDTETGDSEADLVQRTQSLSTGDTPAPVFAETTGHAATNGTGQEKRAVRRRPPPQFEWMAARRRFSASSLSTISRDIQDSQKGQHALWKYIGGGNSHAPLRYDLDRILDSGCGLGEWTMEMAKEFPFATVYGIDINPELFPSAHQPVPSNCLFTQSNLLTRLSFPNHYFDYVYQRFLYLGLTIDDWPVALKELKRVMKPGGWIELFEPCMRVHRAGPRTREVMRWCSRLLQEERGLDFDFAGEKMKRLCESEEIGFQNVRLERLSIPVGSWGGRVGQAMAENMVLIFQNLQSAVMPEDTMQMPNGAAQKAFDLMVQSWIRECEDNKSYIDYFILVGQRPPVAV
ncbi:hypothetical protein BGZ99_001791 [Dissophora globulifera]|uniref:Methyltransferase domain-containing protein n=1 Tax=Dissophora globulifera TaxID=979702 RepID=A0A9P6UXM0_9FUNG|nr:hypothetical protein BGZ99_001791 [Dissophora globulifera]